MYFILKATLRTLLLPPASPLLLAACGYWIARRFRKIGIAFMMTGGLSLWLLSTAVVADALSMSIERYAALDPAQPLDAQAIVIIGGGGARELAPEYAGPAADFLLLDRLDYGAFLAHRTGLPVLVSGAPLEALTMQTSLQRDFGITVRWIENRSRDTYQNALFSAQMLMPLDIKRIVLVTMSTHMWRAAQEFAAAGFTVTPAPTGLTTPRELEALRFIPTASALLRSSLAIYEMIGEPMRRLQAFLGIREHFAAPPGAN